MESNRSKSNKKNNKQLESFKNRLGMHIIWFNALSIEKQFDLLFLWKKEKWNNLNGNRPKLIYRYNPVSRKREKIINPKLKLKHWIISWKYTRRFSPSKNKVRNSAIDIILK
jgi:hypothetical protein